MLNIKIIIGSTRPSRFGPQPAEWILKLAEKQTQAQFELIDLEKQNLPLLDEPVPPLQHQYLHDHTKQWAKVIDNSDGFIFITPEYNHSMSAALKNAIDFVAKEWNYKPVAFVSYGADAGGTRAVEHLRSVAGYLKMYDIADQIMLTDYWTKLDDQGKYQFTEEQTQKAETLIEQIVFWSQQMKISRDELTST